MMLNKLKHFLKSLLNYNKQVLLTAYGGYGARALRPDTFSIV